MKAIVYIFIAVGSLLFSSCSAEQEVITADKNLKSYQKMDFSKLWTGLEYRKNIQQKIEEQK